MEFPVLDSNIVGQIDPTQRIFLVKNTSFDPVGITPNS